MAWMRFEKRMRFRPFHRVVILSLVAALAVLAGCGGSGSDRSAPKGVPTFTLAVSPDSLTAAQGASASYTVTLTSQNGFSAAVIPTVSGLPTGATAAFNPASVTPTAAGAKTTLMVTAGASSAATPTPAGTYNLTVSAVSGAINRQAATSVVVTAPPAPGTLMGNIQ